MFKKIKMRIKNLHIGHGIIALAILAAVTGTAATVLPSSAASIHSLTVMSTLSGAASTIISVSNSHHSRG